MRLFLSLFILSAILGTPTLVAHAQAVDTITDRDISVALSPEIPAPNQQVTITLTSFAVDLNNAVISWSIGGKLALTDRGKKSFSFTMGATGTQTTIDIAIVSSDTLRIDKKIILTPADVDLLYESPDTYTPPFYKGKALPASEALIKVVAVPNQKSIDPKKNTSVYDWKRGYDAVESASGYGKNFFVFKNNYLNKSETVSVVTSGGTAGFTGTKSVAIAITTPNIIMYEKSPSEGILYNRALGNEFGLTGGETTLVAEPYYFAPRNANSESLIYTWKVGGATIPLPVIKNMLLISSEKGQSGVSRVSLSIESTPRLFQDASADLLIHIGN